MGIPFLPFGLGDCQTLLLQGSCFVLFWFFVWLDVQAFLVRCFCLDLVSELFFAFVAVSFCCKTPVFDGRSKVCAGSPSLSMVCLCFRWCFVCLLVGRLVLVFSFVGGRCFCSFCFARVASVESFVCWGVRGGFFLCLSASVKRVSECSSSLVISLLAVPSVLSLPRCCVCIACLLVLCLHTPARIAIAALLSFLPPTCLSYLSSWAQRAVFSQAASTACCCHPSPHFNLLLDIMAEVNVAAPAAAGARRNLRRERVDDQGRNTRQRVDELESRMDAAEAQARAHETRLLFLEAHVKVVLRGFTAVQEFLRGLPGDFKLAKTAFIAALVAELKDKAFAEATHCIEEAETLLCENQGVVVVGVFPTGGHLGTAPDGILRLQPTWAGGRIAYLLSTAGRYLPETHQVFTDRVRRNKGGNKGAGKGKGKPGKGKGKDKGKPQPKRAAAVANPQG